MLTQYSQCPVGFQIRIFSKYKNQIIFFLAAGSENFNWKLIWNAYIYCTLQRFCEPKYTLNYSYEIAFIFKEFICTLEICPMSKALVAIVDRVWARQNPFSLLQPQVLWFKQVLSCNKTFLSVRVVTTNAESGNVISILISQIQLQLQELPWNNYVMKVVFPKNIKQIFENYWLSHVTARKKISALTSAQPFGGHPVDGSCGITHILGRREVWGSCHEFTTKPQLVLAQLESLLNAFSSCKSICSPGNLLLLCVNP